MKDWSSAWKSSKKPRKQHKYLAKAPLHIKSKFLQSHLSKELQKNHKIKTLRVRKGDKVKVMRGSFKGVVGEVMRVDVKRERVFVQGAEFAKKDGSKIVYPIHSSKLLIQELYLKDKKRLGAEKK
ncbi:50S ribosomal protein L24 [Candidatus Woesearchaeota archaeon]|nr:50S ribosomal protein L24 [Candidatus Woesearchaeota archaeon]